MVYTNRPGTAPGRVRASRSSVEAVYTLILPATARPLLLQSSSNTEDDVMAIAKVTEIIAASPKSFEEAIREGIARANKTLKNVEGAWVAEQKVVVEKGKITEYRVTMRVTFILKN
jgi:flavin-binding protein dodecin